MPVRLPTLDDRSYDQLLSDALARIPVHVPDWTNLRDSDPGIILVALLAFLAEELEANERKRRRRRRVLAVSIVASAALVVARAARDNGGNGGGRDTAEPRVR